nr:MAG TPA: tail completion protein [Caudoviricetes sp.]
MTAFELQEDLITEIEDVLRNVKLRNTSGKFTQIKGYEQSLPIQREDEPELFPYFIVRIDSGSIDSDISWQDVKIILLFGIYDEAEDTNGHKDILNLIEKVQQRFQKIPHLNKKFKVDAKMEWTLQDEDTFPYYFGGMELVFNTAVVGKEDLFS